MSNNLSKEKRESIFSTSEFDINELDIYISELKTCIDKGEELMNSLSWIRKLVDHYKELRIKVEEVIKLMDGFEEIILNVKLDEINDKVEISDLDYIDWMSISKFNTLSIEELEGFRTKVFSEEISKRDYLNEEYIRHFKDELYWQVMDKHHLLSDELKKEFAYKFG